MVVGILFAGDRLSCVDRILALEVEGEIVGVATFVSQGEQGSGDSTLVALYVHPRSYLKILKAEPAACNLPAK